MSAPVGLLAALGCAIGLVGTYLALGGAGYKPLEVADPCQPRALSGERGEAEQIALSALDGAACELRVTREELALALASDEARETFLAEHYVSDETLAAAGRAGLERSVAVAEALGTISPTQAAIVGEVVERVPYERVVELLGTISGGEPLDAFSEAFGFFARL